MNPTDTEILDWLDEYCAGCVRGTDYPEWRLQGEEGQTLREAARDAIAKAKVSR